MQKLSDILSSIKNAEKNVEFLPTGFTVLDRQLDGGFLRKELVILGGHTGRGKSYLAGQILTNIAMKGFKTAYFSLEISNEMIVSRFIGSIANLKPTRVKVGFLKPEEFKLKEEAEVTLLAYEDYFSFYDNTYELFEIVEEIKKNQYEFVVIDFIQNLIVKNVPDEYSRLSKIALELQKLTKETNSCIMVLSQLSNLVAREGSNSRVVEYKGSGAIATVADLGFFLDREEYEEGSEVQEVKLYLRKNRRGISGLKFDLVFRHPGGKIYEHD